MAEVKGNIQVDYISETASYLADIGAADAYEVVIDPTIGAYTAGLKVRFKAVNANTGASAIVVNGLASKAIKKNVSTDLSAGDIAAGQIVELTYDGTNFQMSVSGGVGGYTNLTQFVAQTAWRMFYSNTDGDVTELAFGTTGKVLTSNGASAAPTWETPSGGGITVGTTTITGGTNTRILFNNSGVVGEYTVTGSGTTVPLSTSPDFTTGITIGSIAVPTISSTNTLTNKRITARVGTTASSATPTPDGDANDIYTVTALAEGATFGAPTGTPTNGQMLLIRIKDDGTARTLAWNAIYRGGTDIALPTTTVISKTMYVQFIYNSADTKWDLTGLTDGI